MPGACLAGAPCRGLARTPAEPAPQGRLPLGPLLAQRRDLLLRLAAGALEEDAPLPGADAEYEKAREALAALREEEGKAVKNRPEPLSVGS